jgi:L-lactate dehydrogenase complex protein LldE
MAEVFLFVGCIEEGALPEIGLRSLELLESQGHQVEVRSAQTCCGLWLWQEGLAEEARAVAAHNLAALEGDALVVPTSSACVQMLRDVYPRLVPEAHSLAPRVRQLAEMVHSPTWQIPDHERVGLLPNCLMASSGGDAAQRLWLGLEPSQRVGVAQHECCGFGAGLAAHQPEVARHLCALRLHQAQALGCTLMLVSDAGCRLELSAAAESSGCPLQVKHVAEVID